MNEKAMMFVFGIIVGATAFYIGEKIYEKTKKSKDKESEEIEEEFHVDEDNKGRNTIAEVEKEFHVDEDNRIDYTKYFPNNSIILGKSVSDVDNDDEETIAEGVYGISPDEFGEIEGYDTRTLTYYSDGVLVDNRDNSVIEDPSEIVGDNWKDEFDKFEVDAAYIRNDYIGEDFEILKDLNKYSDLYEDKGDK